MPNWCSTVIKFYSDKKEPVEAMLKRFREIIEEKPTVENDFEPGWMGKFADAFFPEIGHDKINCRGWVDGIDDEISECCNLWYFTVWTETAWGAKIGIWNEIVKKFYPDVCIAYIAEECGCGYFCVWDQTKGQLFFPDAFYVDGCIPLKDGKCEHIEDRYQFGTQEDIFKYLDERLPFEYDHKEDLDDLTEELQSKLDECSEKVEYAEFLYIQITEFVEVNPAEFEFLD